MWDDLRYRLRALLRRGALERELEEEMRHHAAITGHAVELEAAQQACRDARGVVWIENVGRDLRLAVRGLRHTPGFAVPAVLTLALGLGAAVTIFSVAEAALVRPLAYPGASQLVMVRERIPSIFPEPIPVSAPDIPIIQANTPGLAQMGSFEEGDCDSASLFPLLGARPRLGHNFTPAQDRPGDNLAILTDTFWRQQLGGDPRALGRTVRLDGKAYTVAGVMPPGFEFPPRGLPGYRPADLFVPMGLTADELSDVGDNFDMGVLGRLAPGASFAQARAQVAAAAAPVLRNWVKNIHTSIPNIRLETVADPLRAMVIGNVQTLMDLLLGAAGLLLLMSCANAVNLFLVRASGRRREWGLRAALGAGRGRLAQQALAEALLVAGAAGGLGVLLAWAALRGLTVAAPVTLPQMHGVGVHGPVLAFALGLVAMVGLACGLVPVFLATGTQAAAGWREFSPTLAGHRREGRLRAGLVVAQVAVAFVLVCGAGLLARSFGEAEAGGAGARATGALTAAVALPVAPYASPVRDAAYFERLAASLGAVPGVEAVAAATDLPTEANWDRIFMVHSQPELPGTKYPTTEDSLVLGPYFRALGIPLLRGREFTPDELQSGANVAVVSAGLAARYWPGQNPIGQKLKWGIAETRVPWLTVIGVAADVKEAGLDQPAGCHTWVPYRQYCRGDSSLDNCRGLYLAVRSQLARADAAAALRRAACAADAGVLLTEVRPLQAVLDASITPRRFNTLLIATFGIAALLLAAVGLYGVLAFAVAGQRREIAVRMALGARPGRILGMVLAHGAKLALLGAIASLLYRTAALDAATWLAVAALLLAVALAACYLPARRASRLPPLEALREG